MKARDGKRLSDAKQFLTAMELCLANDTTEGTYRNCCTGTGIINASSCGGSLVSFLPNLTNFKDPSGTTACTSASNSTCDYGVYASTNSATTTFIMYFYQEGGDGIGNVTQVGVME